MLLLYACPRYRSYRIKHLHFKNGLLKVDNTNDQKLIESNGFYMAHIFPVPVPEEEKTNGKTKNTESAPGDPAPKRQGTSQGKGRRKTKKSNRGGGKAVRKTKTPEMVAIADDSAISG